MSLEEERRAVLERKRNLLHLIVQYLNDFGLVNAANTLLKESPILAGKEFQICDNIDLDSIYLDYMSYYHVKFGKYPKITRKIADNSAAAMPLDVIKKMSNQLMRRKSALSVTDNADKGPSSASSLNDTLLVSQCLGGGGGTLFRSGAAGDSVDYELCCGQPVVLRPLREYSLYTPEWKEMAEIICRDIARQQPAMNVNWLNVKGLADVQQVLVESVIMPLKHPGMFVGAMRPWKCILMHGPPGTGKTLLAKALAAETYGKVTFFNVASSTITSKWRGDSEKFIRVLFELAKFYAPSVLFVDEIDGLASKRDAPTDHEASKRFKNEFLTQIDGLDDTNDTVFLLASTNLPWELDSAFLRRFERKMLCGLPDHEARIQIVHKFLPKSKNWSNDDINDLANVADGFSGDDIRVATKAASMKMIRSAIEAAEKSCDHDVMAHVREVTPQQLKMSLKHFKSSAKQLLAKHLLWNEENGHQ